MRPQWIQRPQMQMQMQMLAGSLVIPSGNTKYEFHPDSQPARSCVLSSACMAPFQDILFFAASACNLMVLLQVKSKSIKHVE